MPSIIKACCCGVTCVVTPPCDFCLGSGAFTPSTYGVVISGVVPACTSIGTPARNRLIGSPDGSYVIANGVGVVGIGQCAWTFPEVETPMPTPPGECMTYGTCGGSPDALWPQTGFVIPNCRTTSYFAQLTRTGLGDFTFQINGQSLRYNGATFFRGDPFSVFSGSVSGVGCNAPFVINNTGGTIAFGGSASFTQCVPLPP